ncbi:hypothetical protein A3K34_00690 [candidate division WWE3 bacterium RIFOXYC1_FULL_40_10]|uniref:Uncharacterized protein n=1 Tax=candidate division WWE3 bacterium RIFOXYA2_FULL_46_9 TaxID=1802636 RepID=A0A1F4W3A2_UNCKA|nr:MAG: hypothetical protein A3K58_00690 [candidate division WWE3 bacterium RIFOXYB1_FULL_40_22]OGC61397.1 MAG: hypothetical protein A3K37_00690 [candidate division WWE3 bacterium RIFOXYA1_FULL_40_11]OGC63904.1 MAG: hypothetical protein A2264_02335 [candidate division WWE3 bacterium RIFOXYA2_FULL_46_9]OGC65387.1 MAG: hypothetical protein A2326_04975 [candidate division WWE3 bacterium RIFOXYB2_FULL_41_6]OGC65780.1 MAG: hypothetical protein A3K34_00690 [candidate division WWE3 bacterium RIFOXYC1_
MTNSLSKLEVAIVPQFYMEPKSAALAVLTEIWPNWYDRGMVSVVKVAREIGSAPSLTGYHLGIRVPKLSETLSRLVTWGFERGITLQFEPAGSKVFINFQDAMSLELVSTPAKEPSFDHFSANVFRMSLADAFAKALGCEYEGETSGDWGVAHFYFDPSDKKRLQFTRPSTTLDSLSTQYPYIIRSSRNPKALSSIVNWIRDTIGDDPFYDTATKLIHWKEMAPWYLRVDG